MRYDQAQLQDRLAAEYVLGTLHGRARQRFERLLTTHRDLAQRVRAWESRLHPLGQQLTPVIPPARVWAGLDLQLNNEPPVPAVWRYNVLRNWGTLAASLVLSLTILFRFVATPAVAPHIVMVEDKQAQPVWLVSTTTHQNTFSVKTLKPAGMPADKMCVLWLQWQDGFTHPLGVLSEERGHQAEYVLANVGRNPMKAQVLITIEDARQHPVTPAQEIVYKGKWVQL